MSGEVSPGQTIHSDEVGEQHTPHRKAGRVMGVACGQDGSARPAPTPLVALPGLEPGAGRLITSQCLNAHIFRGGRARSEMLHY